MTHRQPSPSPQCRKKQVKFIQNAKGSHPAQCWPLNNQYNYLDTPFSSAFQKFRAVFLMPKLLLDRRSSAVSQSIQSNIAVPTTPGVILAKMTQRRWMLFFFFFGWVEVFEREEYCHRCSSFSLLPSPSSPPVAIASSTHAAEARHHRQMQGRGKSL